MTCLQKVAFDLAKGGFSQPKRCLLTLSKDIFKMANHNQLIFREMKEEWRLAVKCLANMQSRHQ